MWATRLGNSLFDVVHDPTAHTTTLVARLDYEILNVEVQGAITDDP